MAEEKSPKNVAIPLSTAEVWTKNHRDSFSDEDSKKRVDSYLISKETLEMVLKLGTSKVRAYVGVNDKKEKTLMFVGAELDEATGIYRDVFGSENSEEDGATEKVVYDFSEPSPPGRGDDRSPLN